jgi:hypothetical protein
MTIFGDFHPISAEKWLLLPIFGQKVAMFTFFSAGKWR